MYSFDEDPPALPPRQTTLQTDDGGDPFSTTYVIPTDGSSETDRQITELARVRHSTPQATQGARVTFADETDDHASSSPRNGSSRMPSGVNTWETTLSESIAKISRPQVHYQDLPVFDGSGSKSYKTFIREFEEMARLGFWTEEEKLAAFPARLDKRPKLYYHRLTKELKKTYNAAKEAVKEMFGNAEDESLLRRELHTIKQGATPLLEYLHRLEELFTELDVHPNAQLDYLTAGLRPDLQDYVYLRQFKKYHEAVKALKLKESIRREKPLDERYRVIQSELTEIKEQLQQSRRQPAVTNQQADIAALLRENNRLKAELNMTNARRPREGCWTCGGSGHMANACPKKTPPTCWQCGVPGHTARQCRNRPSEVKVVEKSQHAGPTVKVMVKGKMVSALCDSGAQVSIVSGLLAKQLRLKVVGKSQNARGISGTSVKSLGEVELDTVIDGEKFNGKFMVLEESSIQMIIGEDFLSRHRAILNLGERCLVLHKGQRRIEVGLQRETTSQAVAERRLYLPPQASTAWSFPAKQIREIEALPYAPIDVRVLTKSSEGVRLIISNRTEDAVELKPGDVIGKWVHHDAEIEDPKSGVADDTHEMQDIDGGQKGKLEALIERNKDVFADSDLKLGATHLMEYDIDTGDAEPIKQSAYSTTPAKRAEIDKQIKELEEQGIIRRSQSSWSSPVLLVPKACGAMRMCIDYRRLNAVTKKDAYPIPRVNDVLDQLGGAKYFSTCDLQSGFHQVPLTARSIPKTAFVTHRGLFEYVRLPFGPSNGPSKFERLLEDIFRNELWDFVSIFIDDIIIHSKTFEEHLEHIQIVFQRLREAGLKMKRKKCHFCVPTLNFLGHEVSAEGIKPKVDNVRKLLDAKKPTTTKQVQAFLGLTGYYRRFVPGYSEIARPLYKCVPKFQWGEEQNKAWTTLIEKLTNPPLLEFPNFNKEFVLNTDASGLAIGYVLSQTSDGEKPLPIRYGGRVLKDAEIRYTITEKELLSLVYAIRDCTQYLEGRFFTVYTDHQPLTHALRFRDVSGRLSRWAVLLQQYTFEIRYKKGAKHSDADAMSRAPIQPVSEAFVGSIRLVPTTEVAAEQECDRQVMSHIERNRDEYAQDESGVWTHLTKRGKSVVHSLVVPQRFRADILDSIHKHPSGAHFGISKTVNKVWQTYFWPGLYQDVVCYIEKCEGCRQHKGRSLKASLQSIPCTRPWADLTVDILGPFHMTLSGNKYILTFVDRFTAWPEAFAIPSCESPVLAQILVDEIISRHGVPTTLLSDNGRNFVSNLMKEVCKILGITKITTTPYHCRTNGICERFHRSVARSLAQYTDKQQEDWDKYLPMILFAYRTSVNESRNFSPFLLNYGYEATLPINTEFNRDDPDYLNLPAYAGWLKETLSEFWQASKENLEKSQLADHQRNVQYESPYDVGDNVFVRKQKRTKGKSFKLEKIWLGPFIIKKAKHPIYQLAMKGRPKWIHYDRLKRHSPTTEVEVGAPNSEAQNEVLRQGESEKEITQRVQETMHESVVEGQQDETRLPEGQYQVESVVSHKKSGRTVKYRIRWSGYGPEDDTSS
eukprot:TCONS_00048555-protein